MKKKMILPKPAKVVEFDEELYKINIAENEFADNEDGKGDEING